MPGVRTVMFAAGDLDVDARGVVTMRVPVQHVPAVMGMVEVLDRRHDGWGRVTIQTPWKGRSTGWRSQNHRFNGFISQICRETGNDFDDIKLYIKRKAMRRGLRPKTNDRGIVYSKVDGEPLPISERDMSVEECSWCIDETELLAAELGIALVEDGHDHGD